MERRCPFCTIRSVTRFSVDATRSPRRKGPYFVNKGFFRQDDQLLRDAHKIRHIPGVIVHGRYDVVTPLRSAWDLKQAWPEADLRIVPDAGHAMTEAGITHEIVEAADRFAARAV